MGGSDCIKHLECASRVEFAIFSIIKSFNRILHSKIASVKLTL